MEMANSEKDHEIIALGAIFVIIVVILMRSNFRNVHHAYIRIARFIISISVDGMGYRDQNESQRSRYPKVDRILLLEE
jgi:hypothetical protein